MHYSKLIPHLFRKEFGNITAVICRQYGFHFMPQAEEIASDTFLKALETWPYNGIPANPTAWLHAVAKNKAYNYTKRDHLFKVKIAPGLAQNCIVEPHTSIDLSEQNIKDSQLQMLFAVCHPCIPAEAQVALALRILCGLDVAEIANAFLSSKETINKRLYRAKKKLREINIEPELPNEREISNRTQAVITTLYLLFNEGYYSETNDEALRDYLCFDAMRLTQLLLDNPSTNLPAVNALYALMCFHASRFAARKGGGDEMIFYEDQDTNMWDKQMISEGAYHMHISSVGDVVTRYHVEAAIAYWHTVKQNSQEKWLNILRLYNELLEISYSPVAALNRAFAYAKVYGDEAGITELLKLDIKGNQYYYTLLGQLYKTIDIKKSQACFKEALKLAKTTADKNAVSRHIEEVDRKAHW